MSIRGHSPKGWGRSSGRAEARPYKDVTQVYLRDATVLHSAGGLFSVALSVSACSGEFCNPFLAFAPLTLSGALPCSCLLLRMVSGLSSHPDQIGTSDHPAHPLN
jgi:hypothetical protein